MVHAVDIRLIWDEIKTGISEVQDSMPWIDWRPEDIYAACINGEAAVFIQDDADPGDSFFISKINTCSRTGERTFFIWIAWSPTKPGAPLVNDWMTKVAIENGCSGIEFITGNEKLVRYANKFGYTKVMYEVRKELIPETAKIPAQES